MNKEVYIILVNYNGYQYTKDCIDSLFNMTNKNFRIIIVDNCSTDNSYNSMINNYQSNEKITILKTKENIGFAGANNYAINHALNLGAESFLLLNNDTEVDKEFLNNMLLKTDENTIVAPLINFYSNPNRVWYGAGYFNKRKCVAENGNYKEESYVNFASGCCMLINRETIKKIGLLSEEYFMYYEDVDYCIKATTNNIRILYTPKAIVYHKVGKTSGGSWSKLSVYYGNRNRFYLIKKYKLGVVCKLYTYVTRIIRLMLSVFKRNNDTIIIKAYKDYLDNKMYKQEI